MPLFEYKCAKCGTKFEVLHKSAVHREEAACPNCHSLNVKKLLSSFSTGSSSASDKGCSSGNCRLNNYSGGCASGLCGME
ncbi:MAG TPA: zinc ribbon domain-containing protein [Ignavibacteriaceae bacterium]|nr:zinc ribbon domain-containing protein [Ignavibacteriaceae bacterium]